MSTKDFQNAIHDFAARWRGTGTEPLVSVANLTDGYDFAGGAPRAYKVVMRLPTIVAGHGDDVASCNSLYSLTKKGLVTDSLEFKVTLPALYPSVRPESYALPASLEGKIKGIWHVNIEDRDPYKMCVLDPRAYGPNNVRPADYLLRIMELFTWTAYSVKQQYNARAADWSQTEGGRRAIRSLKGELKRLLKANKLDHRLVWDA